MDRTSRPRRRLAARRIVAHVEQHAREGRLDELAGGAPAPDAVDWHRRLLRRVFGLGLGFVVLRERWPATLVALGGGCPERLAALDDTGAAAFLANPAVIRNARKLAAARYNAAVVVALREEHGDLRAWGTTLAADAGPAAVITELRRRLRLIGPVSAARLAQDLGVDVLVPHPTVVRTLVRLGWLDDPEDAAAVQAAAAMAAPHAAAGRARGRLGAALLAFATGRWTRRPVCTTEPRCDACPVADHCARCVA
jgi:DNA-3-methyladenine glycosylase I